MERVPLVPVRSDAVVFPLWCIFSGEGVALEVTVSGVLAPRVSVTFSSLSLPSAGWVMDNVGGALPNLPQGELFSGLWETKTR